LLGQNKIESTFDSSVVEEALTLAEDREVSAL